MAEVTKEIELNPSAAKVLEKRYLKKNEEGKVIENADTLFRRVAHAVASAEYTYGKSETEIQDIEDSFYRLMTSFRFLPNSPTLMNAGRPLGHGIASRGSAGKNQPVRYFHPETTGLKK